MILIKEEFEKRVAEIDLYFELLENLLKRDAKLFFANKKTHRIKSVDSELLKVMKANCFLLFYNLVESSIKQSLIYCYDTITSKGKQFHEFKDEIKAIWIKQGHQNFKEKSSQTILSLINELNNNIVNITFTESEISGNLDGLKIRSFAEAIGFSSNVHYTTNNGVKLNEVKNKRNNLAHGDISFAECGRRYTYEDLELIKKQVVSYLRQILRNIETFLTNENYIA